jgi:hypothetical protein
MPYVMTSQSNSVSEESIRSGRYFETPLARLAQAIEFEAQWPVDRVSRSLPAWLYGRLYVRGHKLRRAKTGSACAPAVFMFVDGASVHAIAITHKLPLQRPSRRGRAELKRLSLERSKESR